MTVEYRFSAEDEAFRAEVRAFFEAELPPDHWRMQNDRDQVSEEEAAFGRRFVQRLAERGWLTLHWPAEYGGLGASPMQQLIFNEESGYFKAPGGGMGVQMAGPSIMHHGTDAQKERHLSAIADGDEVWCQGFSEPGSGSDLASLQTRAVLDGDDYVVNGQKIWTSGAHQADWCMLLVRTDPDAPKHRGITYLLMDMKSPGVTVRPLVNMLGSHAFNEIFLEDVRVPRSNVVGEENRGWYVATTTLDYERSGISRIAWGGRVLEEMAAYIRAHDALRTPSHPQPAGRPLDRLGGLAAAGLSGDLAAIAGAGAELRGVDVEGFRLRSAGRDHPHGRQHDRPDGAAAPRLGRRPALLGRDARGVHGHHLLQHRRRDVGDSAQHHRDPRPGPAAQLAAPPSPRSPAPSRRRRGGALAAARWGRGRGATARAGSAEGVQGGGPRPPEGEKGVAGRQHATRLGQHATRLGQHATRLRPVLTSVMSVWAGAEAACARPDPPHPNPLRRERGSESPLHCPAMEGARVRGSRPAAQRSSPATSSPASM